MTAPRPSAGSLPAPFRTKADVVYEHLREQIVNGTYTPGQRLTLAELSAGLGLSQMPVREALLRLEREGLLENEPHKGMRVARLSLSDAMELFEIRCELEGLVAFRACGSGSAALAGELTALNERFTQALARADYPGMGDANTAFHRHLLQAAGSGQLARLLEDVWTRSFRFRIGYRLIPGRARLTVQEHARIIAAIAVGEAEAAREAARAHIMRAGAELAVTMREAEGE